MVQIASPEATWKSLEKAPALLAAMSSCLYVVGFLVVTGFLGSKGVHDHPFLSGRYVMAGGLTAACAVMYYFFVWRKTARRARERLNVRPGLSAAFHAYVTHYFVVEDLFNCACYSVWLIGIFGTTANAHLLALVAAIIYVVDQQIFCMGAPKAPKDQLCAERCAAQSFNSCPLRRFDIFGTAVFDLRTYFGLHAAKHCRADV